MAISFRNVFRYSCRVWEGIWLIKEIFRNGMDILISVDKQIGKS